jgi:type II secretory pathway pseudopilin PulG
MTNRDSKSARARREGGYGILIIVFLTSLLLISTMIALPSVRTQRQREKEQEMIWRGKQYVRAIKLYYRKNGRFPKEIDDLVKPKTGSLRFLRQAYKDPMNKEDGTWRLIYVGPAGQLIGSLKPAQKLQMPGVPQLGTPASTLASQSGAPQGAGIGGIQAGGSLQAGGQNGLPPGVQAASTDPNAPNGQNAEATGTDDASGANPSSLAPGSSPTLVGGNIIGVGSKINKKSIIVYEKAKNYRLFEFVWDPSKDVMGLGGQPGQVGAPLAPGQGAPGFGQQPQSNPMNPNPQGNPPQNPNPQ